MHNFGHQSLGFMAHKSGPVWAQSPFEVAVMNLNPTAAYLFRDASWASQILDYGVNSYHLSKVHATATRSTQLRSTHPGGLLLPAFSTWGTNSVVYQRAATTGLDVPLGGAASASVIIGMRLSGSPTISAYRIFGVGVYDGADSSSADIMPILAKSDGTVWFKERHDTGIGLNQDASPVTGTPVVYTNWFNYAGGATERLLDRGSSGADTQIDSGALSGTNFQNLDKLTFLGGRTAANTSIGYSVIVDHVSVWVPALSIANLDILRALYRAEIIP